MRIAIAVWPMLLASLLSACSGGHDRDKAGGGNAPATVTTAVLGPSEWVDTIDALGSVRATDSVTITAKVSETVDQVHFDSGDFVRAGQALVTLSGKSQHAALAEAEANYREAQALFAREQDLAKKQLIAASQFDSQRAARDAAKARMDEVRAQLSDRAIRAPFDGVLGLRQVSPGALVTPGTVITTLDDVARMQLDFSVPERILPTLAKGQTIIAQADAYPSEKFDGVIDSLDSRVDPVSRAVTVRAQIANPERKLRPGMLLRVSVERAGRQTLQVPELALQQLGQEAYLFVVGGDDLVAQRPVTVGERRPGFVEIVTGVHAGERVVVEGTVKLHDGSKIVEAEPATGRGDDATNKPQRSAGD